MTSRGTSTSTRSALTSKVPGAGSCCPRRWQLQAGRKRACWWDGGGRAWGRRVVIRLELQIGMSGGGSGGVTVAMYLLSCKQEVTAVLVGWGRHGVGRLVIRWGGAAAMSSWNTASCPSSFPVRPPHGHAHPDERIGMCSTSARRDGGCVPQSSTHAGCHRDRSQGTSTSTRGASVAHATHAAFCADLLRCSGLANPAHRPPEQPNTTASCTHTPGSHPGSNRAGRGHRSPGGAQSEEEVL